jgi:hypothetical protein
VVQVRHKDALTSLEWAAELDACAATCRTMPGCSTFISTLGSEGARPDEKMMKMMKTRRDVCLTNVEPKTQVPTQHNK